MSEFITPPSTPSSKREREIEGDDIQEDGFQSRRRKKEKSFINLNTMIDLISPELKDSPQQTVILNINNLEAAKKKLDQVLESPDFTRGYNTFTDSPFSDTAYFNPVSQNVSSERSIIKYAYDELEEDATLTPNVNTTRGEEQFSPIQRKELITEMENNVSNVNKILNEIIISVSKGKSDEYWDSIGGNEFWQLEDERGDKIHFRLIYTFGSEFDTKMYTICERRNGEKGTPEYFGSSEIVTVKFSFTPTLYGTNGLFIVDSDFDQHMKNIQNINDNILLNRLSQNLNSVRSMHEIRYFSNTPSISSNKYKVPDNSMFMKEYFSKKFMEKLSTHYERISTLIIDGLTSTFSSTDGGDSERFYNKYENYKDFKISYEEYELSRYGRLDQVFSKFNDLKLDQSIVKSIIFQLITGLTSLKLSGIQHRNINSSNIFISDYFDRTIYNDLNKGSDYFIYEDRVYKNKNNIVPLFTDFEYSKKIKSESDYLFPLNKIFNNPPIVNRPPEHIFALTNPIIHHDSEDVFLTGMAIINMLFSESEQKIFENPFYKHRWITNLKDDDPKLKDITLHPKLRGFINEYFEDFSLFRKSFRSLCQGNTVSGVTPYTSINAKLLLCNSKEEVDQICSMAWIYIHVLGINMDTSNNTYLRMLFDNKIFILFSKVLTSRFLNLMSTDGEFWTNDHIIKYLTKDGAALLKKMLFWDPNNRLPIVSNEESNSQPTEFLAYFSEYYLTNLNQNEIFKQSINDKNIYYGYTKYKDVNRQIRFFNTLNQREILYDNFSISPKLMHITSDITNNKCTHCYSKTPNYKIKLPNNRKALVCSQKCANFMHKNM